MAHARDCVHHVRILVPNPQAWRSMITAVYIGGVLMLSLVVVMLFRIFWDWWNRI